VQCTVCGGLGVIRYQNIWPAFSIIYLLRPRVYLFVNERGALEKTRRPLYGFCVTLQRSLSLSPFACWTSTVCGVLCASFHNCTCSTRRKTPTLCADPAHKDGLCFFTKTISAPFPANCCPPELNLCGQRTLTERIFTNRN
jgi:hypothetical protein